MKTILTAKQLSITVDRLCHQLIENHLNFENTVLLGLQPRGVWLGNHIYTKLKTLLPGTNIQYGKIDITFYRDDFNKKGKSILVPNETAINFTIENKRVVLIDDVLYTGRSTRAALDAMMDFGRPSSVELLALIDRRFSRELPIQADYVGRTVDAIITENVRVLWTERDGRDEVVLE
ncbi:pyrimidine operon attenuation protein / uracil phosphoribosyltransferase [Chitinophaga costaii]|uniref:Pyrimidine operon attenuation protein / uracil phosphoribosyltransferase n=1 Tax=Chitinophaga costaii TaxID=1335309 RepID=A0A1C4FDS4_9BACT|nr:bifunctional pyr operon transcriptional regulator/uracil phosphoribosyltransferase PyrR [Chitinophaga costaii]PUZ20675.1 bifunctional pyr operon transcriptional regulator/uracil phosphoribosyltransferase PyrR [Chitinophaga costaii]SCC53793.1 pyrimidine operon attenuation protein / uracil phosphoribosyltransferase [Chitinophaga costaii]